MTNAKEGLEDISLKDIKKKGWVKGLIIPTLIAGLTTAGNYIWNTLVTINDLKTKVSQLEDDRSKWGALTELHDKQAEIDIRLRVNENDINWMRWTYQNGGSHSTSPKSTPSPTDVPNIPPPPIDQPKLPTDNPPDPDRYKKMIQQRYGEPKK
jgi:hypothetical protein